MSQSISTIFIAAAIFCATANAQTKVPALVPSNGISGSAAGSAPSRKATSPVLEDVKPVSLNPTARSALRSGKAWQNAMNRPVVGNDGRVTFTYGNGLPVVICAPLRLCVIELQAGEKVNKQPQIGDSVRWIVTPDESGSGKTAQTLVVIKPKESGLDTNLLIATNKRNYYIRLISSKDDYVSRISFEYPDEVNSEWQAYAAKKEELSLSEVAPDMSKMSIERLHFNYSIEGDANFKPVRVIDNGEKTYIQLPSSSKADEIPVLVILNQSGKEQLVNSRYINGWFEVDRIFDRAALILGVGKEQRKIVITNNSRYKSSSFFN